MTQHHDTASDENNVPAGPSRRLQRRLTISAIGCLALAATLPALAQDKFPNRPVSLIVPFPPGGVADIVARALVPALERKFGQSVVVVNKPGAGGAIGAAMVANAKPDGYTLLMALASVSTNPEQEKVNNRPPAFTLNQLAPVARITAEDMMLAVRTESPYKTLADVVADAKKRPGGVSYASSGPYGVYHVATEMFADEANLKLLHAPYAGGAPAMLALLSGQVDIGLVTRSVGAAQLKAGKIRPLAAWGETRWKDYPEVPTVKEAGFNVNYSFWTGVFAPVGVAPEIMKVVREAVQAAVADAQFKTSMAAIGAPIIYQDAPEFARYWENDAARVIKVVQKIGKIE